MFSGLLWHDAELTKDLAGAVAKAAARYQEKFGKTPDVCFINASQFAELTTSEVPLSVQPKQTVLLNHIWLGVSPAPKPVPSDDARLLELARQAAAESVRGDYRIANRPDNPNWRGVAAWFDESIERMDESRELAHADALKESHGQLRERRSVADAIAYGAACEAEAAQ